MALCQRCWAPRYRAPGHDQRHPAKGHHHPVPAVQVAAGGGGATDGWHSNLAAHQPAAGLPWRPPRALHHLPRSPPLGRQHRPASPSRCSTAGARPASAWRRWLQTHSRGWAAPPRRCPRTGRRPQQAPRGGRSSSRQGRRPRRPCSSTQRVLAARRAAARWGTCRQRQPSPPLSPRWRA